jgi:hypothetical protein
MDYVQDQNEKLKENYEKLKNNMSDYLLESKEINLFRNLDEISNIFDKAESRLKNLESSLNPIKIKSNKECYLKASAVLCYFFEDYMKRKKGLSLFEGYALTNYLLKISNYEREDLKKIYQFLNKFSETVNNSS